VKLRILLYCLLGGLPLTIAAMGAGHFAWWWLSGILLAASFVPIALHGPRGVLRQLGVIAPVLFVVTVLCTWSEALIFLPGADRHPTRDLVGGLVLYAIEAVALAVLAPALRLTRESGPDVPRRPLAATLSMLAACGVAYALYYFVFGAITYQFFTRGYYPEAEEVARKLGPWLWVIQIGRGALMALAALPAIFTLRLGRWPAAIAIGALIWVAGGAAPLLPPNDFMGTAQRMIHIVEILSQNAALGITSVLLLRGRPDTLHGGRKGRPCRRSPPP
jgi:hypothetical protein